MNYLDVSEFEAHGLEPATPVAWVAAASSLIDAHCRRPTLAIAPYRERLRLADGRNYTVRLSYLPLAVVAPATSPVTALRGRYAVPRRGDENQELAEEVALTFALPGTWTALDPNSVDFDCDTGELSFPPHPLGLAFSELEVSYNAGFAAFPEPVKFACAQIVRNAQATPALNVRASQMDRVHMQYFADTLLDQTVRKLLAPYVAQKL